ncbi:MAG TPA: ArsR family transcriptional regulator [bacterium (Candidatus Stahlbacteria)]|nr:ArsR family transcriptional regulator [Candidatus Stahlbacteria bacterium]
MEVRTLSLRVGERQTIEVLKALASEPRLRILELLANGSMNIQEISEALKIPQPTITVNIRKLEDAGLIGSEYASAIQGSQKICSRAYDEILIKLPPTTGVADINFVEISMPVGVYKACEAHPTCGLVSDSRIIGLLDDPNAFLDPQHVYAQLIWFAQGFIEYVFPNNTPPGCIATELELSVEICSEAPGYKNSYPSDITLWINEIEIGTWTSPGDFGGKRGKMSPSWWPERYTQYGVLKHWSIGKDGSYIDGAKLSDVTIDDLSIDDREPIIVRFGIKEDAKNIGGINLFGSKFGNYNQDIVLRIYYELKSKKG